MAIDDNTSYELTGAQVKDLANKIKAKAADNIFVGATSAAPGSKGLVPQPQAGDDTKFLSGDGTWQTIQGGGSAVVDFYVDNSLLSPSSTTINLYKDSAKTISATVKDIYDAAMDGGARVNWFDGSYTTTSWMSVGASYEADDGWYTICFAEGDTISALYYIGGDATDTYAGGIHYHLLQNKLTAGSNISISGNTISATDTTYSDFTGATSSAAGSNGLVPAPASGDQDKVLLGDGTWGDATAKLVEMSYGEANAWAKFLAAYNAGSIVYCRASSNANPGTGSQTRKAFMAYVNNASSPTSVEFQYVRSNSSKSDSSQCDQVFVYKLTNSNGGTWSVESRDMAPKILVNSTLNKTFSGGANASVTLGAKAMTGATASAAGAAGYVPAPAAGDQGKVLTGDGSWTNIFNLIYPVGSIYMSVNNTNPGTLFGGTWVAWGAGRVPVGVDTSDTDFDATEETGGEKTHTLAIEEMPSHVHYLGQMYDGYRLTSGTSQPRGVYADYAQAVGTTRAGGDSNGNTVAHNNLQPYITCYMWKRTA